MGVKFLSFMIAVCDDDAEQISYIRGILSKWAKNRNLDLKVAAYSSAEQFLFEYPEHPCDLLLLDIEMTGLNGMELAKKLRSEKDCLPIIFITGFSEYISEGYDVEALHYLLKPIDEHKLCEVLDKYISREGRKTAELLVKTKDSVTHIAPEQIMYIEAFGRQTEITLSDGTRITCEQGIGQFDGPEEFLRCHRSYLVNLRYIKSIGKTAVVLDTGREVPLSRRLYREVNQKFIRYYKGESKS